MNKQEILDRNITDINIGYEMATNINNDTLKKYTIDRLKSMNNNMTLYKNTDLSLLVDSYIIDLIMLINISNITFLIEEKDYFKSRIIDLMNYFPYLKKRTDLIELL